MDKITNTVKIDEKYSIRITDNFEGFHLIRNGKEWQDICGQKIWVSVFYELMDLRQEIERLTALVKGL